MYLLRRQAEAAELFPERSDDVIHQNLPDPTLLDLPAGNWFRLSELRGAGLLAGGKPSSVLFPDNTERSISEWRPIIREVAEWLIDAGRLSQGSIPNQLNDLFTASHERYPSGRRKTLELKGGLFLIPGNNGEQSVSKSIRLLEAFGENPSQCYVQLQSL